ncbi:MAG: electron transport complex subunit E [Clostridia bacterium]|nr:electron transport complex subunit E [Clostridia bacterium]
MSDKQPNKISKIFMDGILNQNPVFVQLLGMCSALAITVSVKNGFFMGLAVTAVLIGSNLVISLLRSVIPNQIRIAAFIVIISGFVTAIEMLLEAYLPDVSEALGLFIPLIVVNCIILARAESFASKNDPLMSVLDGLSMGIGYTLVVVIVSAVREILGSGKILGWDFAQYIGYEPAVIMILPAGGFLALGFLIAAFNKLSDKWKGGDN